MVRVKSESPKEKSQKKDSPVDKRNFPVDKRISPTDKRNSPTDKRNSPYKTQNRKNNGQYCMPEKPENMSDEEYQKYRKMHDRNNRAAILSREKSRKRTATAFNELETIKKENERLIWINEYLQKRHQIPDKFPEEIFSLREEITSLKNSKKEIPDKSLEEVSSLQKEIVSLNNELKNSKREIEYLNDEIILLNEEKYSAVKILFNSGSNF